MCEETPCGLIAQGTERTLQATESLRRAGNQLVEAARSGRLKRREAAEVKRLLRSAQNNMIALLETIMVVSADVAGAEEEARRAETARTQVPEGGNGETRGAEKPLAGKRVCFMGKLSRPHAILAARAAEASATCTPNVTRGTSFVVVGQPRQPKCFGLQDAKRLSVEMIDEKEFWNRLGQPGSGTRPAA